MFQVQNSLEKTIVQRIKGNLEKRETRREMDWKLKDLTRTVNDKMLWGSLIHRTALSQKLFDDT